MQEWNKSEIESFLRECSTGFLYLYTPLCGTCQVAGRMLEIVEQVLPHLLFRKSNLNYLPMLSDRFEIESVPCLIIIKGGQVVEKVYAFHSVPYLLEKVKNTIE